MVRTGLTLLLVGIGVSVTWVMTSVILQPPPATGRSLRKQTAPAIFTRIIRRSFHDGLGKVPELPGSSRTPVAAGSPEPDHG